MVAAPDNGYMFAVALLIILLAVCILAGFYGADSRHDESRRHTPNFR